MKKTITINVIVFLAYAALDLILDYLYVKTGQPENPLFDIAGWIIRWSLPLTAFVATSLTLTTQKPFNKVIASAVAAGSLWALGVLWSIFVGIPFHLWIGGTL